MSQVHNTENTGMMNPLQQLEVAQYTSLTGTPITLTPEIVINFLGAGQKTLTDLDVFTFMQTCMARQLNPFEHGEVYLVKYDSNQPAQTIVGKHAYIRRAERNPEYVRRESGVVVLRDGQVEYKKSTAVYTALNEVLLGGWCRIFFMRQGKEDTRYQEVALEDYDTGKSVWKKKSAAMIEKVAVVQCIRETFPNDFVGMYTEEELGQVLHPQTSPTEGAVVENKITREQRLQLFQETKKIHGEATSDVLREILLGMGISGTDDMTEHQFHEVLQQISQTVESSVVVDVDPSEYVEEQ